MRTMDGYPQPCRTPILVHHFGIDTCVGKDVVNVSAHFVNLPTARIVSVIERSKILAVLNRESFGHVG